MKSLIRFELKKVFRSKSLYICMIVSAALAVLSNAAVVLLAGALGEEVTLGSGFQTIRSFSGDGLVTLLISIVIPLLAAIDSANGTLKNIYAKGFSRTNVYLAKFIALMTATLVFCLAIMAVCGVTGAVLYGMGTMGDGFFLSLIVNVVCILSLAAMYFMITMAVGKAGAGIAICIVGPRLVSIVLSLATTLLKLDTLDLCDYWLPDLTGYVSTAASADLFKYLAIAAVYMVVFTLAGIVVNSRREV